MLKGFGTNQLPVDLYTVVTEQQFSLSLSEEDAGSPHYFMSNFVQRVGQISSLADTMSSSKETGKGETL